MLDWKEISKRIFSLYPAKSQAEIGAALNVSQDTISRWSTGKAKPSWDYIKMIAEGNNRSEEWILFGDALSLPPSANAVRPREPISFVLEAKGIPVVGVAAADETRGSRAGFFPSDAEARFDGISLPETTAAVKILGDSMSPVLLDGQYAFVGPEYAGPFDQPGNYEIVVADVQVNGPEQAGSDARWTGVYCKRVVDAGDVWAFLSINHTGTPFTVAKANCRLWPVIGVWFAGRGKPPKGEYAGVR